MNNQKTAKGFFIFFDDAVVISKLTTEEKGWLLEALLEYAQTGNTPVDPERYCGLVFERLRKKVDSYYGKKGFVRPNQVVVEEPDEITNNHPPFPDGLIELDESLAITAETFNKLTAHIIERPVAPEPLRLVHANTN